MAQPIYKRFKLASAVVLCNSVLFTPAYSAQSITGVMGDYNGFWASSDTIINPVNQDSENNLLAFTTGGVTYSTGVSDGTLDDNGVTYEANEFSALRPIEASTSQVAQGSAADGNKTSSVGPIHSVGDGDVTAYLTDGINGLDISTFVLNVGATWDFHISDLDLDAETDAAPEFLVFNNASFDSQRVEFRLFDSQDNQLGSVVSIRLIDHDDDIANGEYDRFSVPEGVVRTTQEDATVTGFSVALSEFNLQGALGDVVRLELVLPDQADPPFIAYRSSAMLACALGDDDGDGICNLNEGFDNDNPANSLDSDGDGIDDYLDTDSDDDGIPDSVEGSGDADRDGVLDSADLDSDNDGVPDSVEGLADTDNDGVLDLFDLDSDNDGIPDLLESGLSIAAAAALDADGDGQIDDTSDFGTNGLANAVETSDDSGDVDYDGDGVVDPRLDTDGDGVADFRDLDSNNDGFPDLLGSGLSAQDIATYDTDGNGQIDPPSQTAAHVYGTDGILNSVQGGTDGGAVSHAPVDTDGDGITDSLDFDSDNDGIPDLLESGLTLAEIASLDTDGDGQIDPPSQTPANAVGLDGVVNSFQGGVDGASVTTTFSNIDGDFVPDHLDLDSDNDGIMDIVESGQVDANGDGLVDEAAQGSVTLSELRDSDNDGIPDFRELDSDNDGVFDIAEPGVAPELTALDTDSDGVIDAASDPNNDTDRDGVHGAVDTNPDAFGLLEVLIVDGDGDGISDIDELNGDPNRDTDGDGILDSLDDDSDNDGFPDSVEQMADCVARDGTDAPDDGDCNDDGVPDRLQDEELVTAVKGLGSTGFGLLAMLMLVGAGRRLDRRELASKGVLASLALLLSANAQAHDSYSARHVVPDSEQDWVVYNEGIHGGKGEAFVRNNLEFHPGYYFGIGAGLSHVDPEGRSNGFETDDSDSSGWKLVFGQHFKPRWAWEISYADLGAAGLGNATNATLSALVPDAEIDYRVPAVWVKYLPFDPNSNLSADAKVGISVINNSSNDERIGFEEQSGAQLAFGVGAQMRFAQRYFVRADFETYDSDANFASLTLGAYFRGHDAHRTSDAVSTAAVEPALEAPVSNEVVTAALAPIKSMQAECLPTEQVLASVSFDSDSSHLSLNDRLKLVDLAAKKGGELTGVYGYADAHGNAAYNLALSKKRVDAVISYLEEQGVNTADLQTESLGESQSVAESASLNDLAGSRRVDLYGSNCG